MESKSEPPPKPCGYIVPDQLIEFIKSHGNDQQLIELIQQRDAFGRKKYGQPLMSEDGRNGIEDARQELGDLLQYAFKSRNQEGFKEFMDMIQSAQVVMQHFSGEPDSVDVLLERLVRLKRIVSL
jgi:hypothetical protein